jgi:hypothetical protein
MRYLMICYVNPAAFATLSQAEIGAHLGSYGAFNEEAQKAGVLRVAEPAEQAPAFTVSKTGVTEGTLEPMQHMFGGLYIIEVKDRAEAEAWAAKVPAARDGMGGIQLHLLAAAPTA